MLCCVLCSCCARAVLVPVLVLVLRVVLVLCCAVLCCAVLCCAMYLQKAAPAEGAGDGDVDMDDE